ncbi:MAG: DUF1080 domain-containing protein [Planctomycetes bacterium]|nr:DUF1080 domain-containing protein [Planctomycetota bacterium]
MTKKTLNSLFSLILIAGLTQNALADHHESEWISLFDGKTFNGWKASENKSTFTVNSKANGPAGEGAFIAKGTRSHLFYVGPVENADFTDFEFKVDVLAKPNSNGGIFFHTTYQETGWPTQGYEVQVNNTFTKDPRKTGSLYRLQDVHEQLVEDNTWFTEHIIVKGKHVTVKINDKTVVNFTELTTVEPSERAPGRFLNSGTFALQGHDPGSTIFYKNIRVKPSPNKNLKKGKWINLFDGKSLKGWKQLNGTADYIVKDKTILGTTKKGSPNSFLCTTKNYGDYELTFDVLLDSRLNSGVQIRSDSLADYKNGHVFGYQVEIATNGTAGFIYDEARRGWLSKDRSDPAAKKAFIPDQWNTYHVRCLGSSIKTWINNVPVANVTDSMTPSGFIALQVHSFKGDSPATVQWRNIKLRELKTTKPQKSK